MKSKWIKIIIFLLILSLYGSFLVYKISLPVAQDLPRQMQNGLDVLNGHYEVFTQNLYSYTEPTQHFANHHWIYGVIAYLLYISVGWGGMVIFKILLLLFMFCLLFYIACRGKNFYLASLLSIPTILILINRTALRPEIFSFLFVVVFLYFLLELQNNPKSRKIWWLIPLQLLWVNTHMFFGVGVMMVFGMLVQNIILNPKKIFKNQLVKKLSILFVTLILICFINPFGVSGVIFSLLVNTSSTFPISSGEITPIINAQNLAPGWETISATVFFPSILILLLSFIFAFIYRRKNDIKIFSDNYIFFFLASVGSAALPFFIVRGLPLFAIIFWPALVANLNDPFIKFVKYFKAKIPLITSNVLKIIYLVVFTIVVVYLVIIGQNKIMNTNELGIGLTKYSLDPIKFIKANNIKGPIFNDTDIGSYLIGGLYPGEKVFVDNRFGDAYSADFFGYTYIPMLRDDNVWKEQDKKYNFNAIVFYQYDALDGARDFLFRRIYDPEWAWVYVDNNVFILLRNSKENIDVIKKYQITDTNTIDRLKFLIGSNRVQDHIAVADIFNLLGKVDSAMKAYQRVVSEDPSRGKVWMVLGRTELIKVDQANSNPFTAALYLEKAIAEGWKTWESYSYLALAYYRTGQYDRMKWAVNIEKKLDPDPKDIVDWQATIKKLDDAKK